jgi:very-short-patch-repair endonuclease
MEKTTRQAKLLYGALRSRGIKCEMEVWDGHKQIDISIPWARVDIEVDGLQHYTNSKQILSDFKRSHYSDRAHYNTIHVANLVIEHHLNEVADAIAEVARKQYETIKES